MTTGRQVLVAVYAVFALAAGARSTVQLLTRGEEAPLAYSLSLVAAVVYLVATVALRRTGPTAHRVALAAVSFELVGVLTVGTLTVADPDLFPDQTVWSTYGIGYGFVPLVLPVAGLWWLLRVSRSSARRRPAASGR
jgi:hypothetical protein